MSQKNKIIFLSIIFLLSLGFISFTENRKSIDDQILTYIVDSKSKDLQFYWKNNSGENLKSIQNLKSHLESKQLNLLFAMNGGMYKNDNSPQGLFIENNKTLSFLDTSDGSGNFYLKPNGVFYITSNNIPFICKTLDFKDNGKIKFATQSGPMLVIDEQIHTAFKNGSKNLNIRNGVGILPNNKIVFAMSKIELSFYDFAKYFQSLGCKNALYLDGFVSRTYLPEKKWIQLDGNFGVIIGVTTKMNK